MFHRFNRPRLALAAIAATAFLSTAAAATAATAVRVDSGPFVITPGTYWTGVSMTCPAGTTPCAGVLSLETAYAIKPYASRPKAKAKVADVAYSIPAGTTKTVKARVYGPALAQALKTHAVALRLTAWETDATAPAASRTATFRLAHR